MPHNDRIIPYALWSPKTVPSPGILRRFDVGQYQSINGDDGGIWAPASPIIIGGQGLQLQTAAIIDGGVTTGPYAKSGGGIILGDSDWPTYVTPRTRQIVFPLREMASLADYAKGSGSSEYIDGTTPGWTTVTASGTASLLAPLDVKKIPQGASIVSAKLRMRVGVKPNAVPGSLPFFSIIGIAAAATAVKVIGSIPVVQRNTPYSQNALIVPTVLGANGFQKQTVGTQTTHATTEPAAAFAAAVPGGTVVDGAVTWTCFSLQNPALVLLLYTLMPTPASTTAYYNNGQPQELVLNTPNIWPSFDPDNFSYYVSIVDGAATQNTYHSLVLEIGNVTTMKPAV